MVGTGVQPLAVAEVIGIIAESPAKTQVEIVHIILERGEFAIKVGNERGVAVHKVFHPVLHSGIDFAVGIVEGYILHAIVGKERVILYFVEGISDQTLYRPFVVEAVRGGGIEVETIVTAVTLAEVEDGEGVPTPSSSTSENFIVTSPLFEITLG